MSTPEIGSNIASINNKIRVMGFIDGFNLYHALEKFDGGVTDEDKARYRKYKWLCLTSLIRRFIAPQTETLVGVEYFTTYPTWNQAKRLRHCTYVSAQIKMGVRVTFGEFKDKTIVCRASCQGEFVTKEEKQTDINIAVTMLDRADEYDKLILLTADSDQVPALRLIKKTHPTKILASLPPIGRKAKELRQACDQQFKMTEQHLIDCQLPNPFPVVVDGKQSGILPKPSSWT